MSFLNRSISVFLAVVLVFLTFPFVMTTETNAATITTAYIQGDNVRVRSTPSSKNNDNILEKVSYITATVIEKKVVSQSEIWYKITYTNSSGKKITGYVFYDSDYISISTYDPDEKFEDKLKDFPESYHSALKVLHAKYPNWEFIPDSVSINFSDAVAMQLTDMLKQVQITSTVHPTSWRSMGKDSYNWQSKTWKTTNGGWTGASREAVAYYMDPRNFLNDTEIYMFLQQSYNSAVQNEATVKKIIEGTFLAKKYTKASGESGDGTYLNVIMAAAKKSGVSPYIIASKIIQEQGTAGTSGLISGKYPGYEGYYNFFNFGATGSTTSSVIINGLKTAKNNGWNNRYNSIVGGAQKLGKNYVAKGQDTYYYQDFNVRGNAKNQYAQSVYDAYSKGLTLAKTYKSQPSMALSFKIPVFKNMPEEKSPMPVKNSKKNNYYFSELSVDGLTPAFDMYTTQYSLKVTGNTTIKYKTVGEGATNLSKTKYSLKKGTNKVVLTVKSETGYLNDYVITVTASKNCYLYVNPFGNNPEKDNTVSSEDVLLGDGDQTNKNEGTSGKGQGGTPNSSENNDMANSGSSSSQKIIIGDTNGDGEITIIDLAKVQMHLLKVKELTGNGVIAGDTNNDGDITIIDLAKIQMHLLGVKLIEN